MNDSAQSVQNQLSFADSLETGTPSAQAYSPHWPEIAARLDTLTKEIAVALAARAGYLYILDLRRQWLLP
ncbi:MAG TPA: hypothetical protein VEC96_01095, partial [Anaerolineae bacterium]|nr:hypothetical protein [Anaerolineae bacterium]